MTPIWLLEASRGMYDDYEHWVVGVYSDPDKAMLVPDGNVILGWGQGEFNTDEVSCTTNPSTTDYYNYMFETDWVLSEVNVQ